MCVSRGLPRFPSPLQLRLRAAFSTSPFSLLHAGCTCRVHSANKLAKKHDRVSVSIESEPVPCDICQVGWALLVARCVHLPSGRVTAIVCTGREGCHVLPRGASSHMQKVCPHPSGTYGWVLALTLRLSGQAMTHCQLPSLMLGGTCRCDIMIHTANEFHCQAPPVPALHHHHGARQLTSPRRGTAGTR